MHFFVVDLEMISMYSKYKENTKRYHLGRGRVFWQFRKGKNHGQVLGRGWFGKFPKTVARKLGLECPEKYSGHSICRSGATTAANAGASLMQLKQWGNWKSDAVAQIYVAGSRKTKLVMARMISDAVARAGAGAETVVGARVGSGVEVKVKVKGLCGGGAGVSGVGVSGVGVSGVRVSGARVSAAGVSAAGVSAVGVSAVGVGVSAVGVGVCGKWTVESVTVSRRTRNRD